MSVCGWIKSEVYKRNVAALVESFSRILDAAACVKNNGSQLIRRLLDLRMSCKQHWVWRRGFRAFIVNCKECIIFMQQIFYWDVEIKMNSKWLISFYWDVEIKMNSKWLISFYWDVEIKMNSKWLISFYWDVETEMNSKWLISFFETLKLRWTVSDISFYWDVEIKMNGKWLILLRRWN